MLPPPAPPHAALAVAAADGADADNPPVTAAVLAAAAALTEHPAYLYDLDALDSHLRHIRGSLPPAVELLYAVKANPDPALLAVVARHVTGLEVASGGELAHVACHLPHLVGTAAFGGPGKTDAELAAALAAGVGRFHVESRTELARLDHAARAAGTRADVLLRVNLDLPGAVPAGRHPDHQGAALMMGGRPSPFGMDPDQADTAAAALPGLPGIRLRGVHAHLASGLHAEDGAAVAAATADWAAAFAARHRLPTLEVNLGGGMAVDYRRPSARFDWPRYGAALAHLTAVLPHLRLRIEPGRAVTAYCGWYATRVLDVRRSRGEWFAVVIGGTHHLRTPAARGHDQPVLLLPAGGWPHRWPRPSTGGGPVTVVGQLCTPKDMLAAAVPLPPVRAGDTLLFCLAGAYAWNISHQRFLMHPPPAVHHLGGVGPAAVGRPPPQ